jgi:hypothetical protein
MEIHLISTVALKFVSARTGQQKPQLTSSIISSSTDSFYEYLITVIPPSTQPTRQLSLAILTGNTTNITSLTIMACTGKNVSQS